MNDLLQALADADRERKAPAVVEERLRAAFRKRYKRVWWPYPAIAAAVLLALTIRVPKEQTMQIVMITPPVAVVPKPRPLVIRAPQIEREIVTQFYPLMEDTPLGRGEIVRVRVPASAMRDVGLPVSEEHLDDLVPADILVGEEGLARAIRFVY
jgi:hypothetical protein